MSGEWWVLAAGGCAWLLVSELERRVRQREGGRAISFVLHLLAVAIGLVALLVYGGGRWHDILPFMLIVLGVVALNWLFIWKLHGYCEKHGKRES